MIIVGDACTDDTEDVVASFADSRIRFVNLEKNFGEQSGPNNHGLGIARGHFIAFLNHDDLWFLDHLATLVTAIKRTGAGLVFPLAVVFGREKNASADIESVLVGNSNAERYQPHQFIPATLWLFRRKLVTSVGFWRFAAETSEFPSRDWLLRAHQSGVDIRPVHRVTVIVLSSLLYGPGAYARRDWSFHAEMAHRLATNTHLREELLTDIAVDMTNMIMGSKSLNQVLRSLAKAGLRTIFARFGTSPGTVAHQVQHRSIEPALNNIRQYRGLSPLPKRKDHA